MMAVLPVLLGQIEVLVCTNEERTKQWEGYCGWLERRGKERYNVIIDGANLGYFKQNAASAGELADLRQVDWAVRKYEAEVRLGYTRKRGESWFLIGWFGF